jgi:Ca2+-binding EF-hand superfamily protein
MTTHTLTLSLSLSSLSAFSEEDLRRLHKKFRKLDTDGSNGLSTEEFLNITELKNNPLVHRIVETLDEDDSGEVRGVCGRVGVVCTVYSPRVCMPLLLIDLITPFTTSLITTIYTTRTSHCTLPTLPITQYSWTQVEFKELIKSLTCFARTDNDQEKFDFTFKLYDVDHDGFISNSDLFHVLKAMVCVCVYVYMCVYTT